LFGGENADGVTSSFKKTMKSRFGLDQLGQRIALGAMRFLLLA